MRKLTSLAFLLCISLSSIAQDYASCNAYTEIGDFDRARQCLYTFKGTVDPGALNFYKMNLALNEGDGMTAKSLCLEAEKLNPSDPFALGSMTMYIVYSNNAEAAKIKFDPVFKNMKGVSPAMLMEVTRSFFKYKAKDTTYARTLIDMLEKQVKQPNADWLILKGDYLASWGDHGSALTFYNKAIDAQTGPRKALAYYRKGLAYRRIKNPEAAMGELQTAIQLNPEFVQALLLKAEVHFELAQVDQGVAAYEEYFKRAPYDMRARVQMSRSLFAAKKFKESGDVAMMVASKDPENLSAIKLLAYVNYELGNFPVGLTYMESFFAKADTTIIQSRDYEYLSKYYMKNNADSMAIVSLMKALEFEDADGPLFTECGALLLKKNRFQDAFEVYRAKASKHNMSSADNYSYGRAALMIRDYVSADSLFARVCEVQPNWAPGFLMKAKASSNLDPNTTEGRAFPFYEKYIALAEADAANLEKNKAGLLESYRYMGYYHFLKKENAKSKEFFNKVLAIDPKDKQATEVLKGLK